jgi:RNA polymerase sigma-70 factor (ECF subfamily)
MSDSTLQTTLMQGWIERMRAGDLSARDELLRRVGNRLEHMARKMLKRFPNIPQPLAETGDVLANAVMRLLRTLEKVDPKTMRDFYGLAALHIRRELLDLARHLSAERQGRYIVSLSVEETYLAPLEPAGPEEDADRFETWCRFHEEVEKLPVEEREVVGLIFYQGWKQSEVAELFQITERTVRRRWESAMIKLHAILREDDDE